MKKRMTKLQKVRRIFKMKNFARAASSSMDPERMPLSPQRDRSPSIDSVSTISSSNSRNSRNPRNRSYGSFLPSYFTFFRNTLRRSNSSQVRIVSELHLTLHCSTFFLVRYSNIRLSASIVTIKYLIVLFFIVSVTTPM